MVDEKHGEDRKYKIDSAGDHDVEQDVAQAVARAPVNLFSIVKENVDAAPLLQHGENNADETSRRCRSQEIAPSPCDVLSARASVSRYPATRSRHRLGHRYG